MNFQNPQDDRFLSSSLLLRAENTDLHRRLERYDKLIVWIEKAFSSHQIHELTERLLEAAVELSEAERGTYLVRTAHPDNVTIKAHRHRDSGEQQPSYLLDPRSLFDEWGERALQTDRVIRITDKEGVLKSVTNTLVTSAMYVPIKSHAGEGLIWLMHADPNASFTEVHEELLSTFAKPAAISLENILLLDQLKESSTTSRRLYSRLNATQQVASALHSSNNLNEVLSRVMDTIVDVLGFDYATVSLIDRSHKNIHTVLGRSRDPLRIGLDWMSESSYSLDDKDILADVARNNRMETIDGWDERLNKSIYERFGHKDLIRVYLPIPSRSNGCIGVIEAGYEKDRVHIIKHYDSQDLQSFVTQAAIAIENMEAVKSSTARLERLQRLSVIAREMVTNLVGVKEVLQIIADSTKELLSADFVAVLPLSPSGTFTEHLITTSPAEFRDYYHPGNPGEFGTTRQVFERGLVEVHDTNDTTSHPFLINNDLLMDKRIRRRLTQVEYRHP